MSQIEELHGKFLESVGICTDTRRIVRNSIFFALKGERFDGNRFAEAALEEGCSLVVCEREDLRGRPGFLVCDSSLKLMQELALFHRHHVNPGVLAITGSNGKTTTKELSARVLERKFKVLATRGNLNNHIGVPLTLLSLKDEDVAIVELGANHPGEIRDLAHIANPLLGLITNVGKAHLEGFGSLEGVRDAKAELYEHLCGNGGTAIVDGLDAMLMEKARSIGVDVLEVGPRGDLIVDARVLSQDPQLTVELKLYGKVFVVKTALMGAYNLQNIRLAAAVGLKMGVPVNEIAEAIASYIPGNARSQLVIGKRNRLILDAYNANPSSMRESIGSLLQYGEKPKMAILGDMAELGESSAQEHAGLLEWISTLDIDRVLLVGEHFSALPEPSGSISVFRDRVQLSTCLEKERPEGYLILLKGSRIMALEQLREYLE